MFFRFPPGGPLRGTCVRSTGRLNKAPLSLASKLIMNRFYYSISKKQMLPRSGRCTLTTYRTISVIRSRRYCATSGILYFEYGYLCGLIPRLRPQSHQPAKSKKQGAHAGVLLCSPAKPTVHCSRPATARCRCSCASLCCRMQVKGFKRDTTDTTVVSFCLSM